MGRNSLKELIRWILVGDVENQTDRQSTARSTNPSSQNNLPNRGSPPSNQPDINRSSGQPSSPTSKKRIVWIETPLNTSNASVESQEAEKEEGIRWAGYLDSGEPDLKNLIGLEDAFDHTKLVAGDRIAFCKRDRVAYHISTWEFLVQQNSGKCCICARGDQIAFYTLPSEDAERPIRILQPTPRKEYPSDKIIERSDVRNYINRVVTVQDYVYEVYRTKSTGTYFVRFELRPSRKPPYHGFKLVIFPNYAKQWELAGIDIFSYEYKVIRVRGLIQEHEKYGLEIVVNSPNMIEIVG